MPTRTRMRTLSISLLMIGLLCPSAFANETYSILFHKAATYEAANDYARQMSLNKAMIFVQQRKNGEYWVMYGQMSKEEADKTYQNLLATCDWIHVVQTNDTALEKPVTASRSKKIYRPAERPSDRVIAYPETVTNTPISNTYINRIIAPHGRKIKDIVIEKESGVQIQIEGRNAFLTLLKKRDPLTNDTLYQTTPVSIYVVLEPDIVYTIIASPAQTSSKAIELKYDNEKISKNIALFQGMPLEKKVVNLIKSVMTDTMPDSFTKRAVGKEIKLYRNIELYHANNVIVEGEGLTLKEFIVAKRQNSVTLHEKQFLVPELTQYPLGIALEDFQLNQQTTKTRLFIVEKTK